MTIALLLLGQKTSVVTAQEAEDTCSVCSLPKIVRTDLIQDKYTIGVLGIRGEETAYSQYNQTFGEYLSSTAGRRFDPPVTFEMVYLDFQRMYDWTASGDIDFTFVSPSPSACLAAEFGTQSLVSYTSRANLDGESYELSEFAGLVITRADNAEIGTIQDLQDKVVGAVSIAGFGAALLQFHEMQKAGMSYINEPKQIVFTANQGLIVKGVLSGEFDAGFVRTGLIERTSDSDGNLVDPTQFKILQSRQQLSDGRPFPYVHSTPLYPEWNLAALRHVPSVVSKQVQRALLDLKDHAQSGALLQECIDAGEQEEGTRCDLNLLDPSKRCDTTEEMALAATKSLVTGGYAGWRTTLSYNDVRGLLQDTGFILQDPVDNVWRCTRPAELYDSIVCPPGHFKQTQAIFDSACAMQNLTCPEGKQCTCRPCFQAEEIEVAPIAEYRPGVGCPKMSICATIPQTKIIQLLAVDNRQREDLQLSVRLLDSTTTSEVAITSMPGKNHTYQFEVSAQQLGVVVLEILANGAQIPSSPLRIQITARDCTTEFPGAFRVASADGACVCDFDTFQMGKNDKCVPKWIVYCCIFIPLGLATAFAVIWYINKKKKEADSLWLVHMSELQFSSPPVVVGRGSFGLVLLAEYRGARVAVKRVLPPRDHKKDKKGKKASQQSSSEEALMFEPKATTAETNICEEGALKDNNNGKPNPIARRLSLSDNGDSIVVDITDEEIQNLPDEEVQQDLETGEDMRPSKSARRVSISNRSSSTLGSIDLNLNASGGSFGGLMSSSEAAGEAVTKKDNSNYKSKKDNSHYKSKSKSQAEMKKEFIAEMRLLSKLRHPNITTVMGAVFQRHKDPMLIMEYMDHGSLYEVLHNPTMELEPDLMLHIIKDIAQGVRFLHSSNPPVIHGDLKSENILMDSKFRAKLSDFGLSKHSRGKATGTPLWMAPELLRKESSNTIESDMYAIGIILYELYSRMDPYEDCTEMTDQELLFAICDRTTQKRPTIPKGTPLKIKKMMKFLWHNNVPLRPDAKELDNKLGEMTAKDLAGAGNQSRRLPKEQPLDRDSFLYQAFPRHVADVIKRGGKVEPETHGKQCGFSYWVFYCAPRSSSCLFFSFVFP